MFAPVFVGDERTDPANFAVGGAEEGRCLQCRFEFGRRIAAPDKGSAFGVGNDPVPVHISNSIPGELVILKRNRSEAGKLEPAIERRLDIPIPVGFHFFRSDVAHPGSGFIEKVAEAVNQKLPQQFPVERVRARVGGMPFEVIQSRERRNEGKLEDDEIELLFDGLH